MIPFGAWRPDAQAPNSGFAGQAVNAIPKKSGQLLGYAPFPALVQAVSAGALPAEPRGHISLVKFDGTYEVYFATATTIEQMDSSFQFTSVATGLNITAGDDMSFCHFGSYLLNSNTTDGMHAYNVETPAGNNAVSGAPAARFIFSANNVVVALDCNGNNRRMQTSGVGDHTAWDRLGADGKTFEDGGALTGGADLQNGAAVIFQADAMRLMQFGGAPGGALYRISKISDEIGCASPRSIVGTDGLVFFRSKKGFYSYAVGGRPAPIGDTRVDDWLANNIASADDLLTLQAWIDPSNNVVGWRFRANGVASTTVFENNLCFRYFEGGGGEWFEMRTPAATISRIATAGYTVDGPYGSMLVDDNPTPVDDRIYQGGQPVLAALDEDLKFATFSGTPMEAVLDTSELTNLKHQRITGVVPIVDTTAALIQLGTKQRMQDSFTWGSAVTMDADGFAPVDEAGKSYAFRMTIPAGTLWTTADGFDGVEGAGGGPR